MQLMTQKNMFSKYVTLELCFVLTFLCVPIHYAIL